jgi:cytosine deaminase
MSAAKTGSLIVRNALLNDAQTPTNLAIVDGVYADMAAAPPSLPEIDAAGRLCVPGFVEPHIHLDKVLLSDSSPVNVSGTLGEAIEILGGRKQTYETGDIIERAETIIRSAITHGVTRIRTHIDIDTGCGLTAFDALCTVREIFADLVEIQIVAFPQKGIVGDPGCEDLLREVMTKGADQIGGMPDNEPGPEESSEHVEIVFRIAKDFDVDVDMHIDESNDPAARTLEMLCSATLAHGYQGRVTAGQTCALAAYPDDYANKVIGLAAEARVNIITNPATNMILQGREDPHPKRRGITRVKELLAAGVNVAFGQDNLQDMFYPFGTDDPLELAFLLGHAAQMTNPDEIQTLFSMTHRNAAKVLGATDYGTAPGCIGDLVILDARTPLDAIVRRSPECIVIRRGTVVSDTALQRKVPVSA